MVGKIIAKAETDFLTSNVIPKAHVAVSHNGRIAISNISNAMASGASLGSLLLSLGSLGSLGSMLGSSLLGSISLLGVLLGIILGVLLGVILILGSLLYSLLGSLLYSLLSSESMVLLVGLVLVLNGIVSLLYVDLGESSLVLYSSLGSESSLVSLGSLYVVLELNVSKEVVNE